MAGPSERAVFIEAPLTEAPIMPARAMKLPTPMAAPQPTDWAPDEQPRMTLTRPVVSTISHSRAVPALMPLPGRVRPALPCLPSRATSSSVAKMAPMNWATM